VFGLILWNALFSSTKIKLNYVLVLPFWIHQIPVRLFRSEEMDTNVGREHVGPVDAGRHDSGVETAHAADLNQEIA
jgi:hypothetical protein